MLDVKNVASVQQKLFLFLYTFNGSLRLLFVARWGGHKNKTS